MIAAVLWTLLNPTIDWDIPDTFPVNEGLDIGANQFNAACVAGLEISEVLLPLLNPTIDWEMLVTVPVNAGLFKGAFKIISLYISVVLPDNFRSLWLLLYTSIILAFVLIWLVKLAVVISLSILF